MLNLRWLTCLAVVAVLAPALTSQDKFVRASQIAGTEIRNSENQVIGTIEDIVLDRTSRTVSFAIASFSANDAGDKLYAIPWSAMKTGNEGNALVLDLPKDRLNKAPAFDKNNWPDMTTQWTTEIHTFYGVNGSTTERETAQVQPIQTPPQPAADNGDRTDTTVRAQGDNGHNGHRDIVVVSGKVKTFQQNDPAQVLITSDTGEIRAELGPMSFLESQRLTFDPNTDITTRGYYETRGGQRTFVVTEVTGRDGKIIRFRRDDMTPVWAQTTTTTEKTYTTTDRINGNGNGNVAVNGTNSSILDLTGTVTYVEQGGGCNESPQGRLVTIRTDRGDRVIALAPGSYLARQRWDLRPSETIAVRGYESDQAGRRVFFATEVKKGNETWKLRREDGTPLW